MIPRMPQGHVIIDESGSEHAFVLQSNEVMAKIMAKLIQKLPLSDVNANIEKKIPVNSVADIMIS
jgi:hypothetical protein